MTGSQRYYQRYRALVLLAASMYVATAGTTLMLARTGAHTEVFPIFSWDLFSVVPDEVVDYGLRVLSIDGQPLPQPAYRETLDVFAAGYSATAHLAVQELGAAQEVDDEARVVELRRMIRDNYLGGREGRRVRYELVRRRYRVLEKWRTGRFAGETVVPLPRARP